ncbi:MAG: galactokinase family protein [Candidatus Aminicenantes bacterium]|jgi:galactokinase
MDKLKVSAPGRICLFGEHQDYFGLPVIAAAIDLRINISGQKRNDPNFTIELPDIQERESFSLTQDLPYRKERDYLRSVVNVLRRNNVHLSSGWDCTVRGDIPINSGTSSSSALVVAWTRFLLEATENPKARSPEAIAELAFQAEVAEFKEPGGKMDHYASALGGIVDIHFEDRLKVTKFKNPLKKFVLADSLIRKNTTGTLGFIKSHVLRGISEIRSEIKNFSLRNAIGDKEKDKIEGLPKNERRLLKGTLLTRDITAEGESLFRSESFDHKRFGRLLTSQHEVLRDYLHVSAPKLEKMIETALKKGALGAKINGSGEGGCIFAYTPHEADRVAEALKELDTKVAIIRIDEGVRLQV